MNKHDPKLERGFFKGMAKTPTLISIWSTQTPIPIRVIPLTGKAGTLQRINTVNLQNNTKFLG